MDQLLIRGGKVLQGEVSVCGAKNAALGIIPAAILCKDICVIENVPSINDIKVLLNAMQELGVVVDYLDEHTIRIDSRKLHNVSVTYEHVKKIRASYYLLGALLGAYKEAAVALPGGCNIGSRPIDQHIKGFEALGAHVDVEHGMIKVKAEALHGNNIFMDVVSVGATINIMMAAVMAEGLTVIENPAKEPHIVDVANFLNSMGADVKGAGTDIIKIHGVKALHGSEYMIIPDQIEAGTYMLAAAITGGDVTVKNLIPKHMEAIVAKLNEIGVGTQEFDEAIRVYKKDNLKSTHIKTMPYPGFPTDMQPQMTTLLAICEGTSIVTEGIFENRWGYIDDLTRMGATIKVEGNSAIISGVKQLTGAEVSAPDLRAGAALVLAGLHAEGETLINDVEYIDRGYEQMEEKLRSLGADIYRVHDKMPKDKLKIV